MQIYAKSNGKDLYIRSKMRMFQDSEFIINKKLYMKNIYLSYLAVSLEQEINIVMPLYGQRYEQRWGIRIKE